MTALPKILIAPKVCGECAAFGLHVYSPMVCNMKNNGPERAQIRAASINEANLSRPDWCPRAAMQRAAEDHAERAVFEKVAAMVKAAVDLDSRRREVIRQDGWYKAGSYMAKIEAYISEYSGQYGDSDYARAIVGLMIFGEVEK